MKYILPIYLMGFLLTTGYSYNNPPSYNYTHFDRSMTSIVVGALWPLYWSTFIFQDNG